MTSADRHDNWAVGSAYEAYIGRWSRPVADRFLDWLDVPPSRDWLDVGCGTGALAERILKRTAPAQLLGIDPSEGFLAYAAAHIDDPRVSFRKGDAEALPVDDQSVDVVVSGLVLNFVPERAKAAAEMRRVTRPGGTVALYVWDYAEGMGIIRHFWNAAVTLNPAAGEFDEGPRFPICRPEALQALFEAAGFLAVETHAIDIPTPFENFDDYWSPILGGQGPAPAYCMSLAEEERSALRERIKASLPIAPNGHIVLSARAFAVKAKAA